MINFHQFLKKIYKNHFNVYILKLFIQVYIYVISSKCIQTTVLKSMRNACSLSLEQLKEYFMAVYNNRREILMTRNRNFLSFNMDISGKTSSV